MGKLQRFIVGVLAALLYTSAISSASVLAASDNAGYFMSPLTGDEYLITIYGAGNVTYTGPDGRIFDSKGKIFQTEVEENPDTNFKLEEYLRDLVNSTRGTPEYDEIIPVVIEFMDQPTYGVSLEVKREYGPRFENVTGRAKAIRDRIRPLMGAEEELHSKNLSELMALEQSLLTEEEKETLEEVGAELDSTMHQMRRGIIDKATPLIDRTQTPVVEKLEARGYKVGYRGKILNVISARVPISYLDELSGDPRIGKIFYDHVLEGFLDDSTCEIGAPTFWDVGFDGNRWGEPDVAVVDTGITHSKIPVDYSGLFHDEAKTRDTYDEDKTNPTTDDIHGHGTAVAGVIASADPDYKGVAYDVDRLINAKAGWLGTDGKPHMTWSDAMDAIHWAMYTRGADVISFSYGSTNCGNGNSNPDHFFDAVVDDLNVQVVVSAGNAGPGSCTIGSPGSAPNVITVGNVDDGNNCNVNDDVINEFSSRGPTLDGRLKPDITAPGTNIHTTYLDDTYRDLTGTSLAAPHISGASLLLMDRWEIDNGATRGEVDIEKRAPFKIGVGSDFSGVQCSVVQNSG